MEPELTNLERSVQRYLAAEDAASGELASAGAGVADHDVLRRLARLQAALNGNQQARAELDEAFGQL